MGVVRRLMVNGDSDFMLVVVPCLVLSNILAFVVHHEKYVGVIPLEEQCCRPTLLVVGCRLLQAASGLGTDIAVDQTVEVDDIGVFLVAG
jgi:hypothetical protein